MTPRLSRGARQAGLVSGAAALTAAAVLVVPGVASAAPAPAAAPQSTSITCSVSGNTTVSWKGYKANSIVITWYSSAYGNVGTASSTPTKGKFLHSPQSYATPSGAAHYNIQLQYAGEAVGGGTGDCD